MSSNPSAVKKIFQVMISDVLRQGFSKWAILPTWGERETPGGEKGAIAYYRNIYSLRSYSVSHTV